MSRQCAPTTEALFELAWSWKGGSAAACQPHAPLRIAVGVSMADALTKVAIRSDGPFIYYSPPFSGLRDSFSVVWRSTPPERRIGLRGQLTMLLLSLGLGVGIGLLYALASRITYRLAAGKDDRRFFQVILVGVMVRLFLAVTLVVLVLSILAVDVPAFTASFLVVFLIGLLVEVWWLHRHPSTSVSKNE